MSDIYKDFKTSTCKNRYSIILSANVEFFLVVIDIGRVLHTSSEIMNVRYTDLGDYQFNPPPTLTKVRVIRYAFKTFWNNIQL